MAGPRILLKLRLVRKLRKVESKEEDDGDFVENYQVDPQAAGEIRSRLRPRDLYGNVVRRVSLIYTLSESRTR